MSTELKYHRLMSYLGAVLSLAVIVGGISYREPIVSIPVSYAATAQEFGVVGAIPSLGPDSTKQAAIDKMAEAGFGWSRHEFDINVSSFEHYDAAHNKAKAKGIKTLGLLLFTGTDRGMDGWKSYVQNVVGHYGSDITAWEIMNEADNYLSGGDYVTYLKEAHAIIKGINPSATIVLTGITSRPETPNFWSAVAAAGGWNYFDAAGLHVYHSGNPEKVNFGGGDTSAEFDRAVAALKANGGGKKIWITEMGYKVSEVGADNQANYLTRTLALARANSQIEKIFIYRLYDDAQSNYGLTDASLNIRPSFTAVKSLISNLTGAGYGTRLYPANQQTLDSLEATTGWSTKQTSNGTTTLSTAGGKTGNGMKIQYNFTADKAYAIAEKSLPVNGKPEAFAAWFYGDGTKNVWKFRYKDSKGETFQTDLGNIGAEWTYKQFTIEKDDAWVSWDGDGVIDYPISFNSFVIDRQGGDAAANGVVDELVAITGGADLFAYQFGTTVAYWKASGSGTADLCGASRNFTESVQFATGVSCNTTAKAPTTTATTAPKPAASKAPVAAILVDSAKSTVRVDGANVLADGQANFRVVMLFRDSAGKLIKNQKPTLTSETAVEKTIIQTPILVGDEWWAEVRSTEPGERKIKITVGSKDVGVATMTFITLPSPSPSPSPSPTPKVYTAPTKKKLPVSWIALGLLAAAGISGGLWWKFGKKKSTKSLAQTSPALKK